PSLRLKLSQSCIPLIKRNIASLVQGKAEEFTQAEENQVIAGNSIKKMET
ncbi:MAG: hypothetical protein HN489_04680, partial [Opitutae bacterium]|nr:hypothetical protein [Opitutae bacterium]